MTKDVEIKLKTVWTLKLVTNHYTFNSSTYTAKLFVAMFPDSESAKHFSCGKLKAAYMTEAKGKLAFVTQANSLKKHKGKRERVT